MSFDHKKASAQITKFFMKVWKSYWWLYLNDTVKQTQFALAIVF